MQDSTDVLEAWWKEHRQDLSDRILTALNNVKAARDGLAQENKVLKDDNIRLRVRLGEP